MKNTSETKNLRLEQSLKKIELYNKQILFFKKLLIIVGLSMLFVFIYK